MTSGGSKPPFAWSQVNDNGFSKNDNEEVLSSAFYGGKLYIGTFNGLGCEVWRYEGNGWTQVASGGFGDSYNSDALSMAVADGYLYVGTNDSNDPCRVWRYDGPGPGDWTAVSEDGFGVKTNHRVHQLEVYKGGPLCGRLERPNDRLRGLDDQGGQLEPFVWRESPFRIPGRNRRR